jgi:hypothetical protein
VVGYQNRRSIGKRGIALIQSVFVSAVLLVVCMGILSLSRYEHSRQYNRIYWSEAYYAAENALLEGVQKIADVPEGTAVSTVYGSYSQTDLPQTPDTDVASVTFQIQNDPQGVPTYHQVLATAEVMGKTRTLMARVQYMPPSRVFDYEYFLNNWGWWWGSSITGNGDNRSNWDFDYRDRPTVNGHIHTAGEIEANRTPVDPFAAPPFTGWAGVDPVTYCHVGAEQLRMPNLKNLDYYKAKATGTLTKNGATLVNGVFGATGEKSGIYLEGTASEPLQIDGTVVVQGDVILKGKMTGKGTLYVGGNLYIAGDTNYQNGPAFALPTNHANLTPAQRQAFYDTWVDNAFAGDKDMVAFGVRGHVLMGQVNTTTWRDWVCNASRPYGLEGLGREDNLGRDGIRNTADDGVAYKDTDGNGTLDSAAYDADEDGNIRTTNYSYDADFKMSDGRRGLIQGYPTDGTTGELLSYDTVAAAAIRDLAGIFYTNHAVGQYSNAGPESIKGALISRDEAIVFSNSLTFWYDWRIHSRYVHKFYDSDGNKIIDLDLPTAYKTTIRERREVAASN